MTMPNVTTPTWPTNWPTRPMAQSITGLVQGAQALLAAMAAGDLQGVLAASQGNPAATLYQKWIDEGRPAMALLRALAGGTIRAGSEGNQGQGGNPDRVQANQRVAESTIPPGPEGRTPSQHVPSRPTSPGTPPSGMTLSQRVAGARTNVNLAARQTRLRQMFGGSAAQAGIKSVFGGF